MISRKRHHLLWSHHLSCKRHQWLCFLNVKYHISLSFLRRHKNCSRSHFVQRRLSFVRIRQDFVFRKKSKMININDIDDRFYARLVSCTQHVSRCYIFHWSGNNDSRNIIYFSQDAWFEPRSCSLKERKRKEGLSHTLVFLLNKLFVVLSASKS
jgi:hypothetical protein